MELIIITNIRFGQGVTWTRGVVLFYLYHQRALKLFIYVKFSLMFYAKLYNHDDSCLLKCVVNLILNTFIVCLCDVLKVCIDY